MITLTVQEWNEGIARRGNAYVTVRDANRYSTTFQRGGCAMFVRTEDGRMYRAVAVYRDAQDGKYKARLYNTFSTEIPNTVVLSEDAWVRLEPQFSRVEDVTVAWQFLTETCYQIEVSSTSSRLAVTISIDGGRASINWPGCGNRSIEYTEKFIELMLEAKQIVRSLNLPNR